MAYFVVTVETGENIVDSNGDDLFVKVQLRGVLGREEMKVTTTCYDTTDPVWNEKLVFGPAPVDSSIAVQIWDGDVKWDDGMPMYLKGRKLSCHEGGNDEWAWLRLGADEKEKVMTLYTAPQLSPSTGRFTVRVRRQQAAFEPNDEDHKDIVASCERQCEDKTWPLWITSPVAWCKRACATFNVDDPSHHHTEECTADTCVANGEEPTCSCPACVQGCDWAKTLWDNIQPPPALGRSSLPGVSSDELSPDLVKLGGHPQMKWPWQLCRCSLFVTRAGRFPHLQSSVGANSAPSDSWQAVKVRGFGSGKYGFPA